MIYSYFIKAQWTCLMLINFIKRNIFQNNTSDQLKCSFSNSIILVNISHIFAKSSDFKCSVVHEQNLHLFVRCLRYWPSTSNYGLYTSLVLLSFWIRSFLSSTHIALTIGPQIQALASNLWANQYTQSIFKTLSCNMCAHFCPLSASHRRVLWKRVWVHWNIQIKKNKTQ